MIEKNMTRKTTQNSRLYGIVHRNSARADHPAIHECMQVPVNPHNAYTILVDGNLKTSSTKQDIALSLKFEEPFDFVMSFHQMKSDSNHQSSLVTQRSLVQRKHCAASKRLSLTN